MRKKAEFFPQKAHCLNDPAMHALPRSLVIRTNDAVGGTLECPGMALIISWDHGPRVRPRKLANQITGYKRSRTDAFESDSITATNENNAISGDAERRLA